MSASTVDFCSRLADGHICIAIDWLGISDQLSWNKLPFALHRLQVVSALTKRADPEEPLPAMLPTPEHATAILGNTYNHSKKLLSAHEVAAWQMDNEFIKSAYRCTLDRPGHSKICLTDIMAGQPLVPLEFRSLACSKSTTKQ